MAKKALTKKQLLAQGRRTFVALLNALGLDVRADNTIVPRDKTATPKGKNG